MENKANPLLKYLKKDILKEILVDPKTFQYNSDDRENTGNDNEITTSKTTDELSLAADQPEDMFMPFGAYGAFFFYEDVDKSLKKEEILKKSDLKDIIEGDNDEVEGKIMQIINHITDELSEKEKYDLVKEIIKKLKINKLDSELVDKLIDQIKHKDNIL